MWVTLAVVGTVASGYVGYAAWLGSETELIVLNGELTDGTLRIAGREVAVAATSFAAVSLDAGDHPYSLSLDDGTVRSGEVSLTSPLLLRPFRSPLTVLNPGGRGLLARGTATFDADGKRVFGNKGPDGVAFLPETVSRHRRPDIPFADAVPYKIDRPTTEGTTTLGVLRRSWFGAPGPVERSFLVCVGKGSHEVFATSDEASEDVLVENLLLESHPGYPSRLFGDANLAKTIDRHRRPDRLPALLLEHGKWANAWDPWVSFGHLRVRLRDGDGPVGEPPALTLVKAMSCPRFEDAEPKLRSAAGGGNAAAFLALAEGFLATGRPREALAVVRGLEGTQLLHDALFDSWIAGRRSVRHPTDRLERLRVLTALAADPRSLRTGRRATWGNGRLSFDAFTPQAVHGAMVRLHAADPPDPPRAFDFYLGTRSREDAQRAIDGPTRNATMRYPIGIAVVKDDPELLYRFRDPRIPSRLIPLTAALIYDRRGERKPRDRAVLGYLEASRQDARSEGLRTALRSGRTVEDDSLEQAWAPVEEKTLVLALIAVIHPNLRTEAARLASKLNYAPDANGLLIEETIRRLDRTQEE